MSGKLAAPKRTAVENTRGKTIKTGKQGGISYIRFQ